jgi:hypothetical protein
MLCQIYKGCSVFSPPTAGLYRTRVAMKPPHRRPRDRRRQVSFVRFGLQTYRPTSDFGEDLHRCANLYFTGAACKQPGAEASSSFGPRHMHELLRNSNGIQATSPAAYRPPRRRAAAPARARTVRVMTRSSSSRFEGH